jgi:isopropylmalate/homocitrate/citramalate synthase
MCYGLWPAVSSLQRGNGGAPLEGRRRRRLLRVAAPLVCDVGPRDGLQSDDVVLAPETRAELCRRLAAAGLERIEAASFVDPRRVPAMAAAEKVVQALGDRSFELAGLALNARGAERALTAGVDRLHTSYAMTDAFGLRNQNAGVEDGAAMAADLIAAAEAAGRPVSVTLSVAFGCPFTGEVDPGLVIEHAGRMAAAGAAEVLLADTIGVAVPAQVRRMLPAVLSSLNGRPAGLHLHDTRGTALACLDAGLQAGATVVDASIGGLGGCPFAPGATGNVATEDVVYLLERSGIATGIDLDGVIETARWLAGELGHDLPGRVLHAGPFRPAGAS